MAEENSEAESQKTITVRLPGIPKVSPWMVTTALLLVICLVLVAFPQIFGGAQMTGQITTVGGLTAQQAGEKAVDYINNNLVQGGGATFVSSEEFSNDMYKVVTEYQNNEIDVYITKDGKLLFTSEPFDTTQPRTTPTTTTTQPQEVPKSDRPEARAFVMSHCPFGLQFMKAYVPVIELLGDRADIQINFVYYAMHGEKEVYEQLRMHCIQEEQKDKFTDYLRCFVEDGDHETCLDEIGIDKDALQTCMDKTDEEFSITEKLNDESSWEGSFPPFDIHADLNTQYGVGGSPTFVLNDQAVSVNRAAESIKDAICAAFNTPPEECEQELSTAAEQAGFGEIGAGSGEASSGGQC